MEKSSKTIFKSLVFLEISHDLLQNLEIIYNAMKRSLKEIKIYFLNIEKHADFSYSFFEAMLVFLYNYIYFEKRQDFLYKVGIFFPFLFGKSIESILKEESFDALYIPEDLIIEQVISHPKTSTIHSNDDKVSYFSTSTLESLKQCEISLKQNSGKYKLFSLKTSAIGGTFDYLHCGHKLFLSCAALLACEKSAILTIGLTGEELLLKKQGQELIQSFSLRKAHTASFLNEFNPFLELNIVELHEPCGPTKDESFDGLIVTQETIKGGDYINQIREKNGLLPLEVFVIGLVQSGNSIDEKISSGEIRKGLMNRSGGQNNEIKEMWQFLKKGWFKELDNKFNKDLNELWLDRIMTCYLENWRNYHNLRHIYEMMKLFEEFYHLIKEKMRVFLAIWFHDAVYVPGDPLNEENSAELLREFSRDFIGKKENQPLEKEFEIIVEYILFTKDHFKVKSMNIK